MSDLKIELHPQQLEVFNSPAKHKVVAAGRRWGKSRLAANMMLYYALSKHKDKDVYYVAPTYQQARDIMWDMLKNMAKDITFSAHENTSVLTLINGRKIFLKGSDRPETLRGVGLCLVVMDEYAFMKPDVWEVIIGPTLLDVKGDALFIGTPDGKNHFYDIFLEAMDKGLPEWQAWQFNTMDNPFLDKKEVERYKKRMSIQNFKQEFQANFESFSGAIFKDSWLIIDERRDVMYPPDGHTYIAVDPAGFIDEAEAGKYKRTDECAIAVVRVSPTEGWRVKEIAHGRWNVRETALRILRLAQKYKAVSVGIEKGSLKNAIMPYLEDTMRRLQCYPHVQDVSHGGKKKTERITWALQGRFQHGRVVLEDGEWIYPFRSQYNDFPNPLAPDDLLDALAYVDQVAITDYAQSIDIPEWGPIDPDSGI